MRQGPVSAGMLPVVLDAGLAAFAARRRRLPLAWAAFAAWVSVGFRALVLPAPTWVGALDDLGLFVLLVLLGTVLEGVRGAVRVPVLFTVGVVLALFNFCNAVFYGFFQSVLSLDSWHLVGQAEGAVTSLRALFTPGVVVVHLVFPGVLLGWALWAARGRARRSSLALPVLAGAALLGGMVHRAAAVKDDFILGESNSVMNVGRQAMDRLAELREQRGTLLARIADDLEDTYNLPPTSEYRVRTDGSFPLMREPVAPTARAERPHNIVIVLMESFRLLESGIGRGDPAQAFTPHLAALARDGLYFPNFYANGHQTVRGEYATLCGAHPNYQRGQVYTVATDVSLPCLPDILAANGYQTHWISSYTAAFANKRAFLSAHGIQHFHDDVELKKRKLKHPTMGWGPSDEDLALYAVDILDGARAPFFAEVMTLSNHHPFTQSYGTPMPEALAQSEESRAYKHYAWGMQYTDHAIGVFMEHARTRPWFKDTLFVFLGDHSVWMFPEKSRRPFTHAERWEAFFRTPLILYGAGVGTPAVSPLVGSQVDVAPTLLDMVGVRAANAFQGTSLVAPVDPSRRVAVMGNDNGWNIREGDTYCYLSGSDCSLTSVPLCPPGYRPKPAARTCFRGRGDLLPLGDQPLPVELLDERAAGRLSARGRRLVHNNTKLLLQNAFFPARDNPPAPRAEPQDAAQPGAGHDDH